MGCRLGWLRGTHNRRRAQLAASEHRVDATRDYWVARLEPNGSLCRRSVVVRRSRQLLSHKERGRDVELLPVAEPVFFEQYFRHDFAEGLDFGF